MNTADQPPIRSLTYWLSGFAARCRSHRWMGALFCVNVAEDLAADVIRQQETVSRAAYAAEQEALEAAKIIERAAADGLSNADLPAIRSALRHLRTSAKADHAICEKLTA